MTGSGLAAVAKLPVRRWTLASSPAGPASSAAAGRLKVRRNQLLVQPGRGGRLRGLARCQSVGRLVLRGTKVADADLEHLRNVRGLTFVDLTNTSVTAGGVEKLKSALPECRVEWVESGVRAEEVATVIRHIFFSPAVPGTPPVGILILSMSRDFSPDDTGRALSPFYRRSAMAEPNTAVTPTTTPMSGADILVHSLVRHGVEYVFAYPGGASMPIHQALTRVPAKLRTILPRHEQGGGFMAHGYARTTGKVGVCMATSGPGATNFVTCLADAKMDSIPMIAITGQVGTQRHRHRRLPGDADRRGLPRPSPSTTTSSPAPRTCRA